MHTLIDQFLHGQPSVYDVGSFIAIMLLLLVCLGINLSLKTLRRRVAELENTND